MLDCVCAVIAPIMHCSPVDAVTDDNTLDGVESMPELAPPGGDWQLNNIVVPAHLCQSMFRMLLGVPNFVYFTM